MRLNSKNFFSSYSSFYLLSFLFMLKIINSVEGKNNAVKMDKGLKEVYDKIKNLITITEKIAEHTKDIAEIKGKVGAIRRYTH